MPDPNPLVPVQADADADPSDWVTRHRDRLRALVAEHGSVLVRGLTLGDRAAAVAVVRAVIGNGMPEREGFAPRDPYGGGAYSSSHWPADQPMCMHHELSYAATAPKLLAFACVTAPVSGGITALADGQAVLRDLPADLVSRFEREGWRLTRHYNPFVGTPWQDTFGTRNRSDVERYCAQQDVTVQWRSDDSLTTSQHRTAVLAHPDTGQRSWFNQIAFLNEWTMDPDVREFLTDEFGSEALPFNTYFGSGAPLDRASVDHVNEVYEKHTRREPWRSGDLMLVDNIRMAHSREPYQGEREIVVGLGEPFHPATSVSGTQSKLSVR